MNLFVYYGCVSRFESLTGRSIPEMSFFSMFNKHNRMQWKTLVIPYFSVLPEF